MGKLPRVCWTCCVSGQQTMMGPSKSLLGLRQISFNKSTTQINQEPLDLELLKARPTKQGFLVKHKCIRGNWLEQPLTDNWRKRWFQLVDDCLIYSKLPMDSKPKGHFSVEGAVVEMAEERTKKKFCFAVHTRNQTTFLLVASSSDTLAHWLDAIRVAAAGGLPPLSPTPPRITRPFQKENNANVRSIQISMKRVRFKNDILGTIPKPRQHHSAFLLDASRMLILGGVDVEGRAFGDVSVFNLNSATWDPYAISGPAPSPRYGHSIVPHGAGLFVFGGGDGSTCFNDLHMLDLDTLSWTPVPTTGTAPSPRCFHVSAVVSGFMYVVGGKGEKRRVVNTHHALDMLTKTWSTISVDSGAQSVSPYLSCQAWAVFDGFILMFGGQTEKGLSDEVWTLNTRDHMFKKGAIEGAGPCPRKHCASSAYKNRILFVIGGETSGAERLNDVWALDVVLLTWINVHVSGNKLQGLAGMSLVIKDQVVYMFGGQIESQELSRDLCVTRVMDEGLPSINLRQSIRFTEVERLQLVNPQLKDFDIGPVLGTGSFGRVHFIKHIETGRFYALKILNKKQIIELGQVEHVLGERDVLSSICHPHIVNFCGSFQDSRKLYIVMEFVNGGEFFTHLRRMGRFKEDMARFYAAQVLTALEYLHSNNILYRDLKPENLLLDSRGHIKVTDFGFAKQVDYRTWTLCGTPEYLAPEIILSKGHGKAVDYWAIGILIFEMLAGYTSVFSRATSNGQVTSQRRQRVCWRV
eukprot:c12370_g1_i3.p1 GENE.c12370_g1_i3~~c12370_g1_i3.p1  ORF type:complete len:749 (-),score=167.27 c12370_g1_i3:539-2785(-)